MGGPALPPAREGREEEGKWMGWTTLSRRNISEIFLTADKGFSTVISKLTNCVHSELLSADAFFSRTKCQGMLCEPCQAALITLAAGLPIGQNIRMKIRHHLDLIFVGMDSSC
jgi:hypothetical protein